MTGMIQTNVLTRKGGKRYGYLKNRGWYEHVSMCFQEAALLLETTSVSRLQTSNWYNIHAIFSTVGKSCCCQNHEKIWNLLI